MSDEIAMSSFYAMAYSPDGFEALTEAVESQGGAYTPDKHMPEEVNYVAPQKHPSPGAPIYTCGCTNQTVFVITYPVENENAPAGSGYVRACAVCDGMGAWPRYEKEVMEASPHYWMAIELIQPTEEEEEE